MSEQEHWDAVYEAKSPHAVSWYAPHLDRSLDLICGLALPKASRIIDVGGGASTLVGDLLDLGFDRPTVLDISAAAIGHAQEQLGDRAELAEWLIGDVTRLELLEHRYDLWHDRAVFHFLTDQDSRRRYVQAVLRALKPGGHAVVATFGPQGPQKCSGLEVVRYSAEGLHGEFGAAFEKVSSLMEVHRTPWGSEQEFLYCVCRATR